jgi:OPA family glycerol-3-phosphate transporter-like MFS transporter
VKQIAPWLVTVVLLAIVALYFGNNPLKHSRWFLIRRFINWFPLGMTYAFLYMGRYNLVVSKNALGSLMSIQDFGTIFFVGTWVYALSFLVNGPLVDRIGGKKGIIIAAIGSSAANIVLGLLTYLVAMHQLKMNLVVAFSVIYALNMYFQSYGAVSIIKVKAYWFHVRERGIFGAIFGTLISFGVYFAFDWGGAIVKMTSLKNQGQGGWFQHFLQKVFALESQSVDATWAVFFIPAVILLFWAVIDQFTIKDTPEEANFAHFDTHDASSGQMHVDLTTGQLLRKVFASPLMLLIAVVELTSGVFRNGIMNWYTEFTNAVTRKATLPVSGLAFFVENWGLLLCIFGIAGGFVGGLISDKIFQSRRGPPAGILCGLVLVMASLMAAFLFSNQWIVGFAALCIIFSGIGITSLMSGTAATDFGGRKATATCSGIVDGFAYLGSGLQSLCISRLIPFSWYWWPIFLMPFAMIGGFVALKLWHQLPAATKKYLAEVEEKKVKKEPMMAL